MHTTVIEIKVAYFSLQYVVIFLVRKTKITESWYSLNLCTLYNNDHSHSPLLTRQLSFVLLAFLTVAEVQR